MSRNVILIGGPANGEPFEVEAGQMVLRLVKLPEPNVFDYFGDPGYTGINPFPEEFEYRQSAHYMNQFHFVGNA